MLCLLQFPLQLLSNLLFLPVLSSCATFLGCCSTSASAMKHSWRESDNWFLFHDFSLNRMPHVSCARVLFLIWVTEHFPINRSHWVPNLEKKSTQTFFGRKWGILLVKMIDWLPVDIGQGSYQLPQIKSWRGYLTSLIERTHFCLLGTQADPVITDHESWVGQVFGLLTLFLRSYSHLISFLIKNVKARKEPQVSSSIANPKILLSLSLID